MDKIFDAAIEKVDIERAFQALVGINGDKFVDEIANTGKLSDKSYNVICDNIKLNSKDSIIEYFGVVYYYYQRGK